MSDRQIIKKLKKEFDYLDSKVIEMREEAEHMGSEARERFTREIETLKSRADRLKDDFRAAKEDTGQNWESVKEKFQGGLEDIKRMIKTMTDKF